MGGLRTAGEADSASPEIVHVLASPDKFRTDLTDTRRSRICDVAEGIAADVPARVHELGVVEYVEEFTPNLERHGFRDRNDLCYSEIRVVEARAVEEPAIRGTETSAIRTSQNPGSAGWIGLR